MARLPFTLLHHQDLSLHHAHIEYIHTMPTTTSTAKSGEGTSKMICPVKNTTVEERDIVITMLNEGCSNAEVAAHFNRDPATIRKLYEK